MVGATCCNSCGLGHCWWSKCRSMAESCEAASNDILWPATLMSVLLSLFLMFIRESCFCNILVLFPVTRWLQFPNRALGKTSFKEATFFLFYSWCIVKLNAEFLFLFSFFSFFFGGNSKQDIVWKFEINVCMILSSSWFLILTSHVPNPWFLFKCFIAFVLVDTKMRTMCIGMNPILEWLKNPEDIYAMFYSSWWILPPVLWLRLF